MTDSPVVYPPNTALGRFGIVTLVDSADPFVSSMPLAGLVNPLTGAPTVGPLAVLVDHAAGPGQSLPSRHADEWTVIQRVDAGGHPARIDRDRGQPRGSGGRDRPARGQPGLDVALGMCEITVGDAVIGFGSVRSVYVARPGEFPHEWPAVRSTVRRRRPTELAEIMALRRRRDERIACAAPSGRIRR